GGRARLRKQAVREGRHGAGGSGGGAKGAGLRLPCGSQPARQRGGGLVRGGQGGARGHQARDRGGRVRNLQALREIGDRGRGPEALGHL
ncbi:MAG: hypothetical protein AVDCRST_MAG03-2921, partial [uncultured Rubrobacteraceae bacterium]